MANLVPRNQWDIGDFVNDQKANEVQRRPRTFGCWTPTRTPSPAPPPVHEPMEKSIQTWFDFEGEVRIWAPSLWVINVRDMLTQLCCAFIAPILISISKDVRFQQSEVKQKK